VSYYVVFSRYTDVVHYFALNGVWIPMLVERERLRTEQERLRAEQEHQ